MPKKQTPTDNMFAPLLRRLTDWRIGIIIGAILLLATTYLVIVSISYFANFSHDQSLVNSRTIEYLTNSPQQVRNTGGPLGGWLSETLINGWLGLGVFILIFYMGTIGVALMRQRMRKLRIWSLTLRCLLTAITLSMVLGLVTYGFSSGIFWGGAHGHYMNKLIIDASGIWGALIVNIILVMLCIMVYYNDLVAAYKRWKARYEYRKEKLANLRRKHIDDDKLSAFSVQRSGKSERSESSKSSESSESEKPKAENSSPAESGKLKAESTEEAPIEMTVTQAMPIESDRHANANRNLYDPTAELSYYRKPSLELLTKPTNSGPAIDEEEQEENKRAIIAALSQFGISISKIEATVGPTVTLYEIIPAEGVRVAQIRRLEDDLARTLSAIGIRIIAPMPGKNTIGMEVPNKDKQVVHIRSILSSKAYVESKYELPIALGSTVNNEVFVADLAKLPHLLVAGATGQGKSVGLNTIIASLLYKKHPAELKFVLVDPKMVEFSLYARLEHHFLAKMESEEEAIITDPHKVVTTLNSLCVEMDARYMLLKNAGVRNIKDYNKRFCERTLNPEKGHRFMPYIVVIVDEFADLMTTAGKEVETPIARLAQKARAVGIHLIIATQRPSTQVITGLIKANFPSRMAFRTAQMVDSRTILDRPGANQLIGRGDMLFSQDGVITRVQCALIETEEVEDICKAIDDQVGYEEAYVLPEVSPEGADVDGGEFGGNNFGDRDPLFDEAARAVVTSGLGSTSSLQRRFSIGYARAGKIMDQMEAAGIVGPASGGKPRQVLVDIVTLESMLGSL